MQHLKKLGVNLGKYSMEWCIFHETDYDTESGEMVRINDEVLEILEIKGKYNIGYDLNESSLFECVKIIPTYTLQDLLEMMPYTIPLYPVRSISLWYDDGWCISYSGYEDAGSIDNESPLDAAYNMLCWLVENKLLGKEEEK